MARALCVDATSFRCLGRTGPRPLETLRLRPELAVWHLYLLCSRNRDSGRTVGIDTASVDLRAFLISSLASVQALETVPDLFPKRPTWSRSWLVKTFLQRCNLGYEASERMPWAFH
jgi:hypothetical protein